MTVWGDVSKSPGAWMFAPFRWATSEKVEHQAEMVALGRPGVGEAFLARQRLRTARSASSCPFAHRVRRTRRPTPGDRASTGPAYEAMQNIGEDEFLARAADLAREHVVDGVPLRGQIQLFGYIGTKRDLSAGEVRGEVVGEILGVVARAVDEARPAPAEERACR